MAAAAAAAAAGLLAGDATASELSRRGSSDELATGWDTSAPGAGVGERRQHWQVQHALIPAPIQRPTNITPAGRPKKEFRSHAQLVCLSSALAAIFCLPSPKTVRIKDRER